jgi:POT family proton-dependent oligopeptide transporter
MKEHQQHPSSLKAFFATELWERYGFYVTQSLLALFLAVQHHWPDDKIYQLVGTFTALTYFSPIVGGWIADHWIGQKKSVMLGALFLLTSYILLSLSDADNLFLISLASIAVGTGLLKPNVSSLIGNQYADDNPNRTKGFTIFYMGITLGIIMGTTIPSILVAKFGWRITFLSAALGMFISLLSFIFRHKALSNF